MKVKNQFQFFIVAALAFASITTFSSCDDDDPVVPVTNTITDIVVRTASYSVLKEAVVKAGLDVTLKGTGPFTVFAPDNTAFGLSGVTSATVTSTSASALNTLLLYHTIPARILAADVPAGPNAKVNTASGDSVFVTRDARGVFVNGIQVAEANISADNGVIHRLNRSLNNPTATIVPTAQSVTGGDTGLDSLVVAITRVNAAAGGIPGLTSLLNTSILTVFAPTNLAFRQLLTALSLQNIGQIPIATLSGALAYHVRVGRAFSSDIANTNAFTMFAGGNTTLNLTNGTGGGPTITGNGNGGNRSNIIATNVMCRNGVVHVIDRVLLP